MTREASLRVNEILEVEGILQYVLESAHTLADCRYAAPTVPDDSGLFEDLKRLSDRFSIMEDAAVDDPVGMVTATDDDTVTYAITAGNDDEKFVIDEDSGAITVAASLSGEARTSTDLTVEARDEAGGAVTVTVTVSVRETCESGTAVPNPAANPGLVGDCKTLLGLQA